MKRSMEPGSSGAKQPRLSAEQARQILFDLDLDEPDNSESSSSGRSRSSLTSSSVSVVDSRPRL